MAKKAKTEIVVKHRNHKGEPVERVFSKEVHGEKFAKLADEFRKTNEHTIIEDAMEPEDTEDESEDTDSEDESGDNDTDSQDEE